MIAGAILNTKIDEVVNNDFIVDFVVLEVEEETFAHMDIPPAFKKKSRVTKPPTWI